MLVCQTVKTSVIRDCMLNCDIVIVGATVDLLTQILSVFTASMSTKTPKYHLAKRKPTTTWTGNNTSIF